MGEQGSTSHTPPPKNIVCFKEGKKKNMDFLVIKLKTICSLTSLL